MRIGWLQISKVSGGRNLKKQRVFGMKIGCELTPSELGELNWLSIIPAIRHSLICNKYIEQII
jgi:hypothetical protein